MYCSLVVPFCVPSCYTLFHDLSELDHEVSMLPSGLKYRGYQTVLDLDFQPLVAGDRVETTWPPSGISAFKFPKVYAAKHCPFSRASRFIEAMRFWYGILGARCSRVVIESTRLEGFAIQRTLAQAFRKHALPLSVGQLAALDLQPMTSRTSQSSNG